MSLATHRRPMSMLTTWLLAFAILTVQTLGFMHGVAHRPGSEGGLAVKPAATGQPAGTAGEGKLVLLFSSHTSNADCRLYDHATLGGAALHVAPLALPVLLPSFTVATFHGEALARWFALFDARGPPSTR